MKLHELEKNIGATHAKKRVGRGSGSGLGKTSGRGQKGQKARSGGSINPVFEGGQLPLYRRIPKRGFKNAKFKTVYATINVENLNVFEDGTVVTPALLKDTGLLKKQLDGVKVLGNGKLEKKITIQANKFSTSALEKIKEGNTNEITVEVEWKENEDNNEQDLALGSIWNAEYQIPITVYVSQYLGEEINTYTESQN